MQHFCIYDLWLFIILVTSSLVYNLEKELDTSFWLVPYESYFQVLVVRTYQCKPAVAVNHTIVVKMDFIAHMHTAWEEN